jgi:hypothetical protein
MGLCINAATGAMTDEQGRPDGSATLVPTETPSDTPNPAEEPR